MQTQFLGLRVVLMVTNKKTSKNWMITDLITSFSSVKKQSADEFKVRLSNGAGKTLIISVENLNKNYTW